MAKRTGISNRESAESEARERRIFPPIETGRPPAEDASGSAEERPLTNDGRRRTKRAVDRSRRRNRGAVTSITPRLRSERFLARTARSQMLLVGGMCRIR
jgi:hypothetical protein